MLPSLLHYTVALSNLNHILTSNLFPNLISIFRNILTVFVREEIAPKAQCLGDWHTLRRGVWVLDEGHVPGHHTWDGEVQVKTEQIKHQSFPIMSFRKELQSPKCPRVVTEKRVPTGSLVSQGKGWDLVCLMRCSHRKSPPGSQEHCHCGSHSLKDTYNDSQVCEILAFSYLLGALITSYKMGDTSVLLHSK